ncbi:MAG TPA: ATP-binding protein [Paenibacillus sp.]|uniref:sensor histidine kinase n=1 Tax=Paenibacillus sp. TaxID=58172 RepID=UPI0028D4D7CA|nr:ATP-binding protein [Paenibacillus sp.]HUC92702.1 ATP-binding protein [Paenibacillus sp.]
MKAIIAALELLLLFSIPQAIVLLRFAFVFLGLPVRTMLDRRMLLFALTVSVLVDISFFTMPMYVHPIVAIVIFTFVARLFFPVLHNWKSLLLVVFLNFSASWISELGGVTIAQYFIDPIALREGPAYYKAIFLLPIVFLFAVAARLMEKRRFHPGRRIARFLQEARNTPILYFMLLIFIQTLMLALFFTTRFWSRYEEVAQALFYLGTVTILVVSFLTLRLIVKTRDEAIQTTQTAFVGDLMQVFTTIRGQRHDFINHVQVMYSMLKLNKHEQLRHYMEEVVEEIQSVNKLADDIPDTAFGVFLKAKSAIAMDKKIRFDFDVSELPQSFSAVKSIDLVRIVGNLVDNAFDEVMKLPAVERRVSLRIRIDHDESVVITVSNPGEPLSVSHQKDIFSPGFSTKKGDHSGLGLPIVIERTRHYGGQVEVGHSEKEGVIFCVRIPVDASGIG